MDPGRVLTSLFVLFAAAYVGAYVAQRFRQPTVIGEILAGALVGPHLLGWVREVESLRTFSEIGVIVLLFYVGLGTTIRDMLRVGRHSLAVAVLGVALPMAAGVGLMHSLGYPAGVAYFMGAALVATSVGITARVLLDVGQARSRAGQVILGAAVIDDILGLLVLAVVAGLATRSFSRVHIAITLAQAVAFTVFVTLIGRHVVHRFSVHIGSFRVRSPEFVVAMAVCLGLSALAASIGLAALVGAFLAGLVFSETREVEQIRTRVEPVYDLMVPLFFATMGSLVDLRVFLRPETLWLALLITLLAIATKFVGCGLAALPLGRRDALVIGVGMIPRGEVGLVIALVGLRLKVITPDLYGIVVVMCLLTTLLAPPLLWRMLTRRGRAEEAAPGRLAPFAAQDSREIASSEHEISPGDIQDDA